MCNIHVNRSNLSALTLARASSILTAAAKDWGVADAAESYVPLRPMRPFGDHLVVRLAARQLEVDILRIQALLVSASIIVAHGRLSASHTAVHMPPARWFSRGALGWPLCYHRSDTGG